MSSASSLIIPFHSPGSRADTAGDSRWDRCPRGRWLRSRARHRPGDPGRRGRARSQCSAPRPGDTGAGRRPPMASHCWIEVVVVVLVVVVGVGSGHTSDDAWTSWRMIRRRSAMGTHTTLLPIRQCMTRPPPSSASTSAISTRFVASIMTTLHRWAREPSRAPVCAARGTRGEPVRERSGECSLATPARPEAQSMGAHDAVLALLWSPPRAGWR